MIARYYSFSFTHKKINDHLGLVDFKIHLNGYDDIDFAIWWHKRISKIQFGDITLSQNQQHNKLKQSLCEVS